MLVVGRVPSVMEEGGVVEPGVRKEM